MVQRTAYGPPKTGMGVRFSPFTSDAVAKWLGSGLQNRSRRFESDPHLTEAYSTMVSVSGFDPEDSGSNPDVPAFQNNKKTIAHLRSSSAIW